jgi:hypothetical protein
MGYLLQNGPFAELKVAFSDKGEDTVYLIIGLVVPMVAKLGLKVLLH